MDTAQPLDQSQSGLLGQVRKAVKKASLSDRTRQTYQHWITQFIFFNDLKHPDELDEGNIKDFLGYLASRLQLSRAKLNQAQNALHFLYDKVLHKPVDHIAA